MYILFVVQKNYFEEIDQKTLSGFFESLQHFEISSL